MLRNDQTRGLKAASFLVSALLGALPFSPEVMAGPQGGAISAGSGSISQPNAAVTNVIQNTHRMAVDWQSFNLTASETVNFNQPSASAAVLNRIHDQNPSQIFGAINANGRVFLANPNGIVFGQTAMVNVGALIAAGMNISNDDFMAGNYNFTAGDKGAGIIVNRGLINAATGGSVGLLGSTVINEGIIVADYGNIELASGNRAVVNFDGDGLLNIQVSEDVINNAVENDAAVSNRGSLLADGGQVVLTAHAASDVFDNAINNEGLIKAARIDNTGGVIRLVGNSGTVLHSGEISALGENGTGGTVHVLGDRVGLINNASIDVSGDTGGGTVLIGGDYQGQGDLQTASRTYVGSKASINADAIETGDGGKVVVWSDEITRYYGSISSRGGAAAGNGGDVEVSGKQLLGFHGDVDLTATAGTGGTLLLDPQDIYLASPTVCSSITACSNADDETATAETNIGNSTDPTIAFSFPNTSTDISIDITSTTVKGASLLHLQADRDIYVESDLVMTNATSGSVFLEANDDIFINAAVTSSGSGSITLSADTNGGGGQDDGTVSFGASGLATTAGGNITITASEFRIENTTPTVIDAGGGEVTITSSTVSKIIEIGADAGTGVNDANMDIDVTEIGQISADTLTIGADTHTGQIQVESNDVSLSKVSTLQLLNEGDIHINSNLGLTGGEIILNADAANDGGTESLNVNSSITTSGQVDLIAGNISGNASGIITAGILDTSSITGTDLSAATHVVAAYNASNSGTGGISLNNNSSVAALNITGINQTGAGQVTITETENIILSGAITAGTNTVSLTSTSGNISGNPSGVITADSVTLNASNGIGAIAASLRTETNTLSFDNATLTGVVNITNDTGVGSIVTISGNTADNQIDITEVSGNITVGSTGITTNGGASVALDAAQSLNVNSSITTSGQVVLNAGNISGNASGVITAGELNTSSATGTDLTAITHTVEAFSASNSGIGNISLLNNSPTGTLTITINGINQNGTGQVTITESDMVGLGGAITAGSNTVELHSDRMALSGGSINAATVSLQTNTAGRLIDLGSTADTTPNTLELAAIELNVISANTLSIGEASSGTITVSAAISTPTVANLQLTTAGTLNVNSSINATGTVQLTADDIAIPGSISAPGQRVILQPLTAGRQIDLGLAAANTLGLLAAEISNISAGFLEIGNNTSNPSGDITISADITPNVTNALHLKTAGDVTGTAGGILGNRNLAIESGGSVNITAANTDVDQLAIAAAADQDVTFIDSFNLNVDDVDGVAGVSGNNISLTSTTGHLAVFNSAATNDINANGSIQLTTLQADQILFTDVGSILQGTGTHTYTSDIIVFDGAVSASGQRVILQSASTGYDILLGAPTFGSVGSLWLQNSRSLDNITADTVVVGNTAAGNINVQNDVTLMSINDLHIVSGGDVTATTGGILGDKNLAIQATGNVGFTAPNTDVNTLAISGATDVDFTDTNDLVIGDVDGIQGVSASRDVILTSTSGGIIDGNGAALDISGNQLILNAQTGIGDGDALETAVASLEASNGTSGNIEIVEADSLTVVDIAQNADSVSINALANLSFNPGVNLTSTNGDITLLANGAITGSGALTLDAGNVLNIGQAITTNGDTSLTASLMDITRNITVNNGFLDIISDNTVTISPNITVASDGLLSIKHPDDVGGSTIATDAGANLVLSGAGIYLPGALNVNNGNLSLNATTGLLDINDAVSTTASGNISIVATRFDLDVLGAGAITSAGTVSIADNGNNMLLVGSDDGSSLHISKSEYDRISATRLFLSSADLTIQESFTPATSVPLTINATNVTIPQANTQITLLGSLDFSDSIVNAGPGLAIDVNQFAMNNQLNVSGALSITSAAGVTMGLPSKITTTNGQVDMVTTGGDVLLGLIDVGNANVNITASAGSILNNNGVFTDITRSETNVRSTNVTLDANQRIGVSSTDAITLDINSEGLITLDFGAPKAFINNLQNTRIVNLGSGDVAIGLIFSSEIIGTGHYVGVNNDRDPPATDADVVEAEQPEMISVLGADYKAVSLDEEEEITSTLSPTVPVLIRTSRGWEFKAPSRYRQPGLQPGGAGEQYTPEQKKGTRFIDWL